MYLWRLFSKTAIYPPTVRHSEKKPKPKAKTTVSVLPTISMNMQTPDSYLPIMLQSAVAAGFVILTLILSYLLGPRRSAKGKDINFECGVESQGNARFPVSVKYFMTAILFVLFDVEIVFFYPYAVNFKEMGMQGFLAVVAFVAVFLSGFFYVLKKGALEWDK